jgi:hypothetical protein
VGGRARIANLANLLTGAALSVAMVNAPLVVALLAAGLCLVAIGVVVLLRRRAA